ncbi:MAG: hypothetical protein ACI4CS_07035 [Candidatus Weimeria sp.]
MIFSYFDNDDLCIVIKGAKNALEEDNNLKTLVGELLLKGSENNTEPNSDSKEAEPASVDDIPDAGLLPEEVVIDSDETFRAVAADLKAGRFNGPLRADAVQKLNDWVRLRICMPADKMEEFISFLNGQQQNAFLINYDSIIPDDVKKTVEGKYPSYDVFLLSASEDEKRDFIRMVLKRFTI